MADEAGAIEKIRAALSPLDNKMRSRVIQWATSWVYDHGGGLFAVHDDQCGARGMAGVGVNAADPGCMRRAGHPGSHGYADGSGEQDDSRLADELRKEYATLSVQRDAEGFAVLAHYEAVILPMLQRKGV